MVPLRSCLLDELGDSIGDVFREQVAEEMIGILDLVELHSAPARTSKRIEGLCYIGHNAILGGGEHQHRQLHARYERGRVLAGIGTVE